MSRYITYNYAQSFWNFQQKGHLLPLPTPFKKKKENTKNEWVDNKQCEHLDGVLLYRKDN